MKKLLLILLCLPMIGFGQNIVIVPNNGDIGDTINVFVSGTQSDFLDSLNNPISLYIGADCWQTWYPDCGFNLPNNINNWQYDSLLGVFGFYSTIIIPTMGFTPWGADCFLSGGYTLMTFDNIGLGVDTPPFGFGFYVNPLAGCISPMACNYDSCATVDDSSCVYPVIWQQTFLICNGDSVVIGSNVYDTTGNYTDTLNASNGCDSIVYTNISIMPPIIWQQAFSICNGDSVVVGSSVYNIAGNYTDTLNTSSGCDSIVYTNISMNPPVIWQQTYLICDGDSIVVGSSVYNTAGTYTDTLSSANGCDSIVYTYIVVDQNTSSYDTLSINASIVWNGMTLTVSGDYSVTLTNSVGCDSIVNLNLTINPTGLLNIKNTEKTLFKVTDVLGRETKETNQPLFYIYDDGTVEKKIIIE